MRERGLRIGEVAARAGANPRTIRFYESVGVLPSPARESNGYRLYGTDAVDMLRFVKQAQGLGLTLREIKEIIAIRRGGRPPCRHVYGLLKEKSQELDRKLRDLQILRRRIRQSLASWGGRPTAGAAVCPHIEVQRSTSRRSWRA